MVSGVGCGTPQQENSRSTMQTPNHQLVLVLQKSQLECGKEILLKFWQLNLKLMII